MYDELQLQSKEAEVQYANMGGLDGFRLQFWTCGWL